MSAESSMKQEGSIEPDQAEPNVNSQICPIELTNKSLPKSIEVSKNIKVEPSEVFKTIELTKNLKLDPFTKSIELAKPLDLPKSFKTEFTPKPIQLPKGFKIEPIPKHLEIPITKPFQLPKILRNQNLSKMVVETDHSKYTFPMQMTNPYERDNWTVSTDHCYARPWNWRPETTFLKPAKMLFVQKNNIHGHLFSKVAAAKNVDEEEVDVETEYKLPAPMYDLEMARKIMEECDKQAALIRGDLDENWEEKVNKTNWSPSQHRLYNGMVTILNNYHLAKLSQFVVTSEPILRRSIIDRAVSRTRRLFATVSLDMKLLQWLHHLLLDNLDGSYLGDYLDILQTLKAKLPNFVDKMIYESQRVGALNNENISNILKKPWDPVASTLNQDKPKKLPGGPIIILVPSGPVHTKRAHKWMLLLANLGNVVSVPTNFTGTGTRLTMTSCLDQLFALTRGRVQEMRETYPGKHIILVGFGAGATLALQVAHVETVFCVVSLGFSLLTAGGRRGEPDDSLLELQCPVLFVIGQSSSTCFQEDLEDLRSRMRVETGLIVVGSADNCLRVTKKKKKEEGITQSIVDRCIIDEMGEFISELILSPFPPQIRQSPTPVPEIVPKKTPKSTERKRYNSNASSVDSEPPSPASNVPRLGRVVRPAGASRIKSKLEAKWAAQIAQGTSSTSVPPTPHSPTPSNNSTVINIDDSSSDTASASDGHSCPTTPQKSPQTVRPSPLVVPSKGIVLATSRQKKREGLIQQLSPGKKYKTAARTVTGGGEKSVKITIAPTTTTTRKEPARIQAYNLNRNLPLKGQLSTLLQGGIKTIPPVQNKSPSTIKVLENVQLTSQATAKLISTATGRTIDLSKLTTVNAGSNVMLLPDGKIKTVQTLNARVGGNNMNDSREGRQGMGGCVPNNHVPRYNPSYDAAPNSVSSNGVVHDPYDIPYNNSVDVPRNVSQGDPPPPPPPHNMAPPNMLPLRHPPPRYGRPLYPLPPVNPMFAMYPMKKAMPFMRRRPKILSSSRRPTSMIGSNPRPIKRHTYVPLPSQPLPPPTNLTSQDIMDLPIIFADDNQMIDANVPTDLSTTRSTIQPLNKPSKLVSSTTPTNKFVIVNKQSTGSGGSNFILTSSSVKRPMSMMKQVPNKYAKIILSKKGIEENIRLSTVKLPPDAISIPKIEQIDLESELKTSIVQKPRSMMEFKKNLTVLPKNATMEAFEKMEEAAVQEDDDPDYIPPKNLKL